MIFALKKGKQLRATEQQRVWHWKWFVCVLSVHGERGLVLCYESFLIWWFLLKGLLLFYWKIRKVSFFVHIFLVIRICLVYTSYVAIWLSPKFWHEGKILGLWGKLNTNPTHLLLMLHMLRCDTTVLLKGSFLDAMSS
jgi:hypothetical protein